MTAAIEFGSRLSEESRAVFGTKVSAAVVIGAALFVAGCANQSVTVASQNSSFYAAGGYDPRLGVYSSPRLVADGEAVPRGGGTYLVGRPYKIAGRQYVPREAGRGYSAVGTASWYGDAFHGRRTANGEIFDKGSISAAHPTLPLPSYVRVTNLGNGRSLIVRVNDRGPYHGGRVMDVSERVASMLDFKRAGTGHIKIDYIGRAGLAGDDEERLASTLRTDGQLAQLDGMPSAAPEAVASNGRLSLPPHFPLPEPAHIALEDARAAIQGRQADGGAPGSEAPFEERSPHAPFPPPRPFDVATLSAIDGRAQGNGRSRTSGAAR